MMITHLLAHIFEICDPCVSLPQRAVHLLEGLRGVVSGNTFRFDIVEEVLNKMHLGEVPAIL